MICRGESISVGVYCKIFKSPSY